MKLTRLFIDNPHGFTIRNQPVSIGIPLAPGALGAGESLCLGEADQVPVLHGARVLSCWPDGSVRWILVETLASVAPGERITLDVSKAEVAAGLRGSVTLALPDSVPDSVPGSVPGSVPAPESTTPVHYHSANQVFRLEPDAAQLLAMPRIAGADATAGPRSYLELLGDDGQTVSFEVATRRWIHHDTDHSATLETVAMPIGEVDSCALRVLIRQTLFARTPLSRVEVTLHNPRAALHPGGLWDLGDPGSLRFQACAIVMEISDGALVKWQLNAADQWHLATTDQLAIVQASSGGDAWDSPVHLDEQGNRWPAFRGYRISDGENRLAAGYRCAPAVRVESTTRQLMLRPENFWQSFPKALSVNGQKCRMDLFPAFTDVVHELQGGESSTSVFHLAFGGCAEALDWVDHPLQVSLDRSAVFRSGVLSDWQDERLDGRYSALLERGVAGEQSFFQKREMIDEYGWRNFGELYADHETWNQSLSGIFVSHYNNQYDVVYGFARQYLQTGDSRWFVLMRDLARHVLDIDLYRTDADRLEYNQGLFWHTDHYVQACSATHRTYSRQQNPEHPEQTGGGPGGQHCYTSGLRLYHQLTGDARARQAVFDLAHWIGFVYEGTGSMLEQARASLQSDLPALLKLLKGGKVLRYRYPLDRGVGNYIRALLDCFELDGERRHLDRAGAIIKNTIGPADVIDERDLSDIEGTWFYTIFLQAVVTFLDAKRQAGELDDDFHHARSALLHYARWMVQHERPCLDRAEKLEYPNDTWVAQDVRKASVLHAAYRYSLTDRETLLASATRFKDYVISSLENSDTVHYTRIQAILLQNHGPVGNRWCAQPVYAIEPLSAPAYPNSHATLRSHAGQVAAAWWHCWRTFSIRREMAWLKHRLPRIGSGDSAR